MPSPGSWRCGSSAPGLYACLLTARADALFELTDAILCADHPVTSLVRLSLEAEFTRGHGALYDALKDGGEIDEEVAFAALLTGTLPQLIDGGPGGRRGPGSTT